MVAGPPVGVGAGVGVGTPGGSGVGVGPATVGVGVAWASGLWQMVHVSTCRSWWSAGRLVLAWQRRQSFLPSSGCGIPNGLRTSPGVGVAPGLGVGPTPGA